MIFIWLLLTTLLIDGQFAAIGSHTPGCAVAVTRNGQTILQRAYGQADLNLDVPLTAESVFYIASDSKQFTAMSVALLADEGKLQLDDSIVKWIPELPRAVYGAVTIRDLIHHTSGVRDYWALFDIERRSDWQPFDQRDFLQLMVRQRGLNFEPGSQFEYSNSGYALLAIAVNRASGQPLGEFAAENIFRPLGMTHTSFDADHRDVLAGLATGYVFQDGRYQSFAATVEPLGDGGLRTTVGDLMLWLQNLAHNRLGRDPNRVAAAIFEPGRLKNGGESTYAFGFAKTTRDGYTMYDHTGSYAGFRSFVAWMPEPKLGVATLCNAESPNFTPWDSGLGTIDQILGASPSPSPSAAASTTPVALTPKQMQPLTGTFIESDGTVWTLSTKAGLLIASVQGIRFRLQPLTPTHFLAIDAPVPVQLFFTAGRVLVQVGTRPPGPLTRFTAPVLSAAQVREYAGAYYSADLDVTLYVSDRHAALQVRREGAAAEPLQPVARDDFRRGSQDLHFVRNTRGRVNAFTISASGADRVLFTFEGPPPR